MMNFPSSNYSTTTSRRSNTRRKTTLVGWFDGIFDKACCAAAGYTAGDVVDDNSIAYSESTHNNENSLHRHRDDSSVLWDVADDSLQWMLENKKGRHDRQYRREFVETRTPTNKPPSSPSSDATATTVLTGSSSSSRGISPRVPRAPACKSSDRCHSTGTMRRPEDEWQHQEAEQRRISDKKHRPREVLVPIGWQHEHGLRRIHSDTYKLPFPTVQPKHRVYPHS